MTALGMDDLPAMTTLSGRDLALVLESTVTLPPQPLVPR